MSVESFSGEQQGKPRGRERFALASKRLLGGLAVSMAVITGATAATMATAEGAPGYSPAGGPSYSWNTQAILVGGTDDPGSGKLHGFEQFTQGAPVHHINYPAQIFPYDYSVNEGANRVYEAITAAPPDRDFIVIGHSQGGHAAWNGIARVVHDQPHRRDNIEFHSFGDPGHPDQGIFRVLPHLPGMTVPPPRPDIGVDTTYYCIESPVVNDSVCNYPGDPVKAGLDWYNTHPQDLPYRFAQADPARLAAIPLSPSVREVLLHE